MCRGFSTPPNGTLPNEVKVDDSMFCRHIYYMDVMEAIMTRRSVRSFLEQKVSHELIEVILAAAVHAPSAGNLAPWRFAVMDEPELIDKACRFNLDAFWGLRAPMAVVVCADLENYRRCDFWVQDCAAVTENILLLAHDKGLGATWTGVHPVSERVTGISRLLRLPASVVPFSMILLGYPKIVSAPRRRSIEGRIQYNRSALSKPPTAYSFVNERKSRM